MSEGKGKILVVRGGAIGDFILTLPVLAALRKHFPNAQLEILAYPKVAELAVAGGLAHAVRSIDARPLAGFFARGGPLSVALAEYFGGFALVISYLYDPDKVFETNVGRCSKAQFIAAQYRPDEQEQLHATAVFLKPLERLAIFDADPVPRLDVSASADSRIEPKPEHNGAKNHKWLAVHPGSGSERKNWPELRWSELLAQLAHRTNMNLLLVGGEAEGGKLERLAKAWPNQRVEIARNLPLVQLAATLQRATHFIGHDSGITHLAAALGLRGLVLWGPSNADVWRPLNPAMRVLNAPDGLVNLSVDEVLHEFARLNDSA